MSHVDKQGRRIGDCGHYLRAIGPDVYRCDECEKSAATVTIPRARYEALMGAVKALEDGHHFDDSEIDTCPWCRAIAALGAAGIQREE